jgi:hypothetical protein
MRRLLVLLALFTAKVRTLVLIARRVCGELLPAACQVGLSAVIIGVEGEKFRIQVAFF